MKDIKTLYSLTDDLLRFDRILEHNNGEMTPELDAEMDYILLELEKKLDGVVGYRSYLKDLEKKAKDESERFKKIEKSLEKRRKTFEEYIKNCMQKIERENIKTEKSIVYITKRKKINYNEEEIPTAFKRTETITKIDYDSIKEFIKFGDSVNGVSINEVESIIFKERGK